MDKVRILRIFGQRLKQIREKKNLTQAELAEKVDLSPNFIGMVERAERNTSFINIYKIITALDYSFEEFFKGL